LPGWGLWRLKGLGGRNDIPAFSYGFVDIVLFLMSNLPSISPIPSTF
jgi:hypothetical protein